MKDTLFNVKDTRLILCKQLLLQILLLRLFARLRRPADFAENEANDKRRQHVEVEDRAQQEKVDCRLLILAIVVLRVEIDDLGPEEHDDLE